MAPPESWGPGFGVRDVSDADAGVPDRRFSRVSKVGVLWHSVVAGESRSLSNDETRCRGGLVEVEAPKLDSAIAFEKLWKIGDIDSREPAGGKGNDASIRLAGEANGDESNSNGDFGPGLGIGDSAALSMFGNAFATSLGEGSSLPTACAMKGKWDVSIAGGRLGADE